jgi:hypothetical protein
VLNHQVDPEAAGWILMSNRKAALAKDLGDIDLEEGVHLSPTIRDSPKAADLHDVTPVRQPRRER